MNGNHHPYVNAAIEGEVARLASAQEGERNQTLFKATASLASLGLREGEILHFLKPAAESAGLRGRELYSTVKSGVKAGSAKPRQIPEGAEQHLSIIKQERLPSILIPQRSPAGADGKRPAFVSGKDGPTVSADEIRRHVYRRNGKPVRMKIKRTSGFVNWYRVVDGDAEGWQAAKPDGYTDCPYIGPMDPSDPGMASEPLFWPEGERDCDSLGRVGVPAMTFGGTGDGLPVGIDDYLRDRNVVILADNDAGGRNHAAKKAAVAHRVAASVKLVEFSELPLKGDVTDYLQNATVDDLKRLVSDTPMWLPRRSPNPDQDGRSWRDSLITARQLGDKAFKPVSYVVPGYIPDGVTIFAGKPKIGKSWLLYDVCVACAFDRFVLGTIKPAQGSVLYLALEDSQRRLKDRLAKLCAKTAWNDRLSLVTEWRRADAGGVMDIAEWCDSVSNPVLVVIDTLERIRPIAKMGVPAYTTDYLAISDLHKLAHERGIAIVVIHHVRKMEAEDPFDMVSGTNGLSGAADTILVLKKQSGNVTLFARGRDIEEKETACQFNKMSCRWTLLGEAAEVQGSGQRSAILEVLRSGDQAGMHISEIMAGVGRSDRNAVDQLLFKMCRDGDIARVKRGLYALPGKIGKKERYASQITEVQAETADLTDLTHLTGDGANAG